MTMIIEKISIEYPQDDLFLIWKNSLSMFATKEAVSKRIKWAYNDNICGTGKMWVVKETKTNKIIGCCALIPRFFFINGQKVLAALIADTAIKPKYRTLGPALKLHREILNDTKEFSMILAFPDKIVEGILKVVGFKKAMTLVHVVKILKSDVWLDIKVNNKMIRKILMPLSKILDFGLKFIDFKVNENNKYAANFLDNFDHRFDKLCRMFRLQYDFMVEKNVDYLSWKFINSPFRKYNIFAVENKKSDEIIGFFVFFMKESSIFVEDFLWIESEIDFRVFVLLFTKAIRKKKFKSISFYVTENSLIHKNLRKSLFFRSKIKSDQNVFYYTKNEKVRADLSKVLKNSFLTMGDRDI